MEEKLMKKLRSDGGIKPVTLVIAPDGTKKLNDGDWVIAIQGNQHNDQIDINMDWVFKPDSTAMELVAFIGGFLGNLEELLGEEFVTKSINHWAKETGKIVDAPGGKIAYLKGRGDIKIPKHDKKRR